MRCNSIKTKISTWANESHSNHEAQAIEHHIARCPACHAYRESVRSLDWMASGLEHPKLDRDLRPTKRPVAKPRQRPFMVRNWAIPAGLAAMFVGVELV